MRPAKLFVYTDGGAAGNPGPAAIGVVVKDQKGKNLASFGSFIGRTTNNVAEYQAVIEALKWLKINHYSSPPQIQFFLDSKLVANQLNGLFKVKEAKLRNLIVQVRMLEEELGGNVFYQYIPREKNTLADGEVKKILERPKNHRR